MNQKIIQNKIYDINRQRAMLDFRLVELYQVEALPLNKP